MQCSVCHKLQATIHILDLDNGSVTDEQSLCPSCAETAGIVHPKATPLKISPEMLEDLLGSAQSGQAAGTAESTLGVPDLEDRCPACGMTASQFRSRGRLGCPRCYEVFRKNLLPLLERVHDATSHKGRCPGKPARMAESGDKVAELRAKLAVAIAEENYEVAARLRDEIDTLREGGGEPSTEEASR